MALTFPTGRFGFNTKEVNIERQTLKGGTAISGEQDVVSTDGGGRVFAEFGEGSLVDRATNLAWRALVTGLEEGVTAYVVPFCEARFTPRVGRGQGVPHSDGTPFSDGSLYRTNGGSATIAAPAAMRAVSVTMALALPQALLGGEWFSIEHPTKGWRAYRIARIDGNVIEFRPPLREALTGGEAVEFMDPRCLMVADGRQGTGAQYGRLGAAAIRFVEAP